MRWRALPDLSSLTHDAELGLIRKLAEWPRNVELAARVHEPHRVAGYLAELAAELPRAVEPGQRHARNCASCKRAIRHNRGQNRAGAGDGVVIQNGLAILGITALDEMR